MSSSIQDIEKLLVELIRINREQSEEISHLREENALLQEQLSRFTHPKNSHNSNLPPSKDPIGTKRHSLRKPSGLKSGGQKGHKGTTLEFQIPDKTKEVSPHYCSCCGYDLCSVQGEVIERRQQIDLPPIKPIITEYHQLNKICPCCSLESKEEFPSHITSGISYGPSLQALVTYLNVCQHIPYKRLTVLLGEVFGLNLSQGTIYNILQRMQQRSSPAYEAIREMLRESEVAGADETTSRVNGKVFWDWALQTRFLTYVKGGCSRKKQEFETIMPDGMPHTVLVTDCHPSYFSQQVKHHQICTSHILRELIGLAERYNNHPWCEQMANLIRGAIHLRKTVTGKIQSLDIDNKLEELLNQSIDLSCKGIITLQNRLIKYRDYLFYFLIDENVPADNNASERAIRVFKIKHKVSGGFRSNFGIRCFAQLYSIADTAKKNNRDTLAVFHAAALNR